MEQIKGFSSFFIRRDFAVPRALSINVTVFWEVIPCNLADRYQHIWWSAASIFRVIFEPCSSKMLVSIYNSTQHHIRRDQRIHYKRGSNFLRTSEVPYNTSQCLVSSIQECCAFFLLPDYADNWKYNWWWKCNEYHISMLLENYGTVIQLQVLKKSENCNMLCSLCLLIHKSQFDVCSFVGFCFACFPACFFVYTHIWQTTLIITWFQWITWYHMYILSSMVHKSQCTVNDRENLDLMENNEIRAPVEFSIVITAEYGAEIRVLSEADELRLGVFERKILRRIYGPICDETT